MSTKAAASARTSTLPPRAHHCASMPATAPSASVEQEAPSPKLHISEQRVSRLLAVSSRNMFTIPTQAAAGFAWRSAQSVVLVSPLNWNEDPERSECILAHLTSQLNFRLDVISGLVLRKDSLISPKLLNKGSTGWMHLTSYNPTIIASPLNWYAYIRELGSNHSVNRTRCGRPPWLPEFDTYVP
jgi:hypothetical protein